MQNKIKKFAGFFDFGKHGLWRGTYWLKADPGFQPRLAGPLQYGAFFLLLFGIKLLTIHFLGSATPFGDQWDAEAALLYRPWLDHTLAWKSFIVPHNEHRILTTRVLALALLAINKIWNPLLQMIVNAGLHVLAIMLTVTLLRKATDRNNLGVLLAFSLILFSFPYAWENTLMGFQSQFYFVMLFGVGALWLLINNEPLSWRWFGGLLCSVLAFFSLASGVFVSAAAAVVSTIVFFNNRRRTPRQLTAIVILLLLFAKGVSMTPSLPGQELLKVTSLRQFYDALVAVFGWPVGANMMAAVLCNIPVVLFAVTMLWKRPAVTDKKWFLLAFSFWAVGQALSISYGRGTAVGAPRYRDLFAVLLLANFACLLSIARDYLARQRTAVLLFAGGWVGVIVVSVGLYSAIHLPLELGVKLERDKAEESNMRNYIATHDISYLKNKPEWFIPYPDAEELARRINLPGILNILPANISAPFKPVGMSIEPANSFTADGYYITTPKREDTAWGSYTKEKGDSAMGQLTLHYKTDHAGTIAIPLAGYPVNDGIKLEIGQNGTMSRVPVGGNPAETWSTVYSNISKGDFTLRLTDSSTSTWLAVANPGTTGRLDHLTNRMLNNSHLFILTGIGIIFFLLIIAVFNNRPDNFENAENRPL